MDWTKALERNRDALAAILLALAEMLRFGTGETGRITRELRRAVLRLLQPAESAVRRLIVIAARGLVVTLAKARRQSVGRVFPKIETARKSLPLFDRQKTFLLKPRRPVSLGVLCIRGFGDPNLVPLLPQPAPPPPDPTGDGWRLSLRVEALQSALGDLPGQALRLARLTARRKTASTSMRICTSPLRPGYAPGRRAQRRHPVDDILAKCQGLARRALADTS